MNTYPDFSSQNYQVIRELGRNREGGRISFLAECLADKQQVVIKQFRFVQENASWQGFKVYEREISILQALNHPRIPRYLDSFETNDGFCMVQEYKAAPTLAMRKSFEPEAIQQIAISVLEILVDLQKRVPPIFHRDIKPENILVDRNNQAYLIDFGLARVNSQEVALSSVMAGTPGFMPPEELFNRPLTTASDLYSFGATLISLLTNTSAAEISRLIDENYQFQFRHLVKGINPDFVNWLQKMVAPNAKDRFSHAAAALQELRSIAITGKSKFQPQNDLQKYLAVAGVIVASVGAVTFYSFISLNNGYSSVTSLPVSSLTPEEQWFNQIKPSCNSVEVATAMSSTPYPPTSEGAGYGASCYALAGKIDLADRVILQLPPNARAYAASIVFNIGHPVADAGDDKSAGLIMNLVLRYWPDNYMALFHAGMSEYILNDYPQSKIHLESFLRVYQQQDGWADKAKSALDRMEKGIIADQSFKIRE